LLKPSYYKIHVNNVGPKERCATVYPARPCSRFAHCLTSQSSMRHLLKKKIIYASPLRHSCAVNDSAASDRTAECLAAAGWRLDHWSGGGGFRKIPNYLPAAGACGDVVVDHSTMPFLTSGSYFIKLTTRRRSSYLRLINR
jgi:hypothetical protein